MTYETNEDRHTWRKNSNKIDRRNPHPRRGDPQEHPYRRIPVGHGQGAVESPDPHRLRSAATATWTRNWSGAARMSRTGPTWWSMHRRSISRKRSTPRCSSTTCCARPRMPRLKSLAPARPLRRLQRPAQRRAPRPSSTSTMPTGPTA